MNTRLKYILIGVFGSLFILFINDIVEQKFDHSIFAMFGGGGGGFLFSISI
jgi:hypothetical protein